MNREIHIDRFNEMFIRLCAKYSRTEAYRMAEKWHKHKHGSRLYKNYSSFRMSRTYHLQKKKNNRAERG